MELIFIALSFQLQTFVFSQEAVLGSLQRNPPPGNPSIRDTIWVPEQSAITESVPMCANIMCTMEFIPEQCRETPIQIVNGVRCRGCHTWAEHCRNKIPSLPTPVPDSSPPPEVSCPLLACPLSMIPPGCEYIETYEFKGRQCEKCPVWRSGCTETSGQITCPLQKCPWIYIPPQCKEVPTYTFNGRRCQGCPRRKKDCDPAKLGQLDNSGSIKVPEIPQITCPLLICNERIPPDCQVKNTYKINDKICDACPTWKDKCKPPKVTPGLGEGPRMVCPLFKCPGNIPDECTELQPYEFQGQTCFKCPKWRIGCVPDTPVSPKKSCPLMRCEQLNAPIDCIEDSFFIFEGQKCQGCPAVKAICKPSVHSPAVDSLPSVLTETVNITLTEGCPPQRCPFIYIPPECEERESFIYNGKICYKCPRRRADCGGEAIRCPPVACPLIHIPPECEQKQPYQYQGRICYKCPKHKEGCVPYGNSKTPMVTLNEVSNHVNDQVCPPVRCPLILIPKECEEKQPFQYEGRTCYGCPKWRKGCAPGNSNTLDPGFNKIACPLFGCPRIYIPQECIEEQPYNFQGKICYMCPKWRKGCVPKNGNGAQGSGTTNKRHINQPGSNLNPDVIAIDPTVPTGRVACPLFKCPRIRIPAECVDDQPFDFNGKTCFKCPRWRPGCIPNKNTTRSGSKCPALTNCPSVEIPTECREETPYFFEGQTCYGCPKYREGCIPSQIIPQRLGEVDCPLMACPRIHIPPECKEEHPYDFNGKTCYDCPTLKQPCIPDAAGGFVPRTPCPLLDCPDVRIPEECKEVKTYTYQGRDCEKCPSWKIGCSPTVPVMITDKETTPGETPSAVVPGTTGFDCPVPKCPRIRIPEECKLLQSYQFQGQTCYKCPIWRPGCLPGSSDPKPTETIQNGKSKGIGSSRPAEITPRRLMIETNMAAISCPRLPCPRMSIPVHCQEQTTYTYKGKTCLGCPVWSSRCDGRAEGQGLNMNGLLSLSLFNELLLR